MNLRHLTCLTALAATLACLPAGALAGPGATTARRSCGLITSASIYRYARVFAIRHVSCRTARRVAKAYDGSGRMLGSWRCGLARDSPRLFSCGSGGSRGDLRKFPRALEAVGTNRR